MNWTYLADAVAVKMLRSLFSEQIMFTKPWARMINPRTRFINHVRGFVNREYRFTHGSQGASVARDALRAG